MASINSSSSIVHIQDFGETEVRLSILDTSSKNFSKQVSVYHRPAGRIKGGPQTFSWRHSGDGRWARSCLVGEGECGNLESRQLNLLSSLPTPASTLSQRTQILPLSILCSLLFNLSLSAHSLPTFKTQSPQMNTSTTRCLSLSSSWPTQPRLQ